ncbi:CRISPR-associated endoribonuclease Cas6 [Thermoactinomyces mirandus]|uniref:CRISPR-associated endoribonuclease Cas6 n=1 Tax=Thermoactinomyces mirandus TaxID=2756294 RepID=UPI0028A9AB45|nr:CRISPR-associated endoribonuclease Cas6 [Thermoactinomyces mirandus]
MAGEGEDKPQTEKIRFERQLRWQISSCLPGFVKEFGQSLLMKDFYYLNGQPFKINRIHYETVTVNQPACVVQMLSPITVHNTFVSDTGHKTTHYFSPCDPAFVHLINQNLSRKYFACYGKPIPGKIRITPLHVSCRDRVFIRFKGLMIEAWNGLYLLEGDPKALTFACAVGLGRRNSSGFGLPQRITVSAGTKRMPRKFVPVLNLHNGRHLSDIGLSHLMLKRELKREVTPGRPHCCTIEASIKIGERTGKGGNQHTL